MDFAPQIRIIARYIVGGFLGFLAAQHAVLGSLDDPAIVEAATAILSGVATELWYSKAKKNGGAL